MSLGFSHLCFRIIIIFLLFQTTTCSKSIIKHENRLEEPKIDNAALLVKRIKELNNRSPHTYSTNFLIEGIIKGKKVKLAGNTIFNNNPRRIKIDFIDAIFKSPLITVVQNNDLVKIYFPIEKKLFLDNINTIDISNYANIEINIQILYDLFSGSIPLIKDYTTKKALKPSSKKISKIEGPIFLILKNINFYQTISFKNNIPDKILWVNRKNNEKVEVYLEGPRINQDINFYNTIRLVHPKQNCRITLQFKEIKFNIPVDIKKIVKINLHRDVKIIKMI